MDRELLVKLLRNNLTEEETCLVNEWLGLSEQNRQYYAAFRLMWEKKKKLPVDVERNYTELFHKRKGIKRNIYTWCKRTAVIVLLLGTSLYMSKYYINHHVEQEGPVVGLGTEAVLHAGDKETFVICKKEERQLIRHEGMLIEQGEKALNYNILQDASTIKPELHVLEVPHGGEFLVELEDGSKIWVNAESNLEYLVPFAGKERRVKLDGEAYFQVAKADMPFIVEFDTYEIRVLGTEFNVRAYKDNETAVATLVNGQISLIVHGDSCTLYPGEQAQISNEKVTVTTVNTANYIAWREGIVAFEEERLENIMNELQRWYDIDVFYDNESLKNIRFTGKIDRYKDVQVLLDKIERLEVVRFEVNGNCVLVKRCK